MKTIVAIYTGKGLADPLQAVINKTLPDFRLISLIDDNIIGECVRAGGMTAEVQSRLLNYYACAEKMGADVILNTCSSVGEAVYEARKTLKTPIIRIDEPMAKLAVSKYSRIGVVATLPTTLNPTMRLLEIEAEKIGKPVQVLDGLAKGAYDALVAGDPAQHDALIAQTVKNLESKADCILLAQGSMARMEAALRDSVKIPVYASPQLCADYIADNF